MIMMRRVAFAAMSLMIAASGVLGDGLPDFPASRETRVEYSGMKHREHYLVYVPKEYDPSRSWPIVFCYHGLNQKPKTWPFKQVLRGKGFIIVGMGYNTGGLDGYDYIDKDIDNVEDVAAALQQKLNIDEDQMFIGGFSKGGFMVCAIEQQTADMWAGLAIMGAGVHGGKPDDEEDYANKAVYIGVGEKGPNRPSAERAAEVYKELGSDVTVDIYPGKGHAVDANSKTMREWFWSNGPLQQAEENLKAARKARKENALGKAYRLANSVAEMSPADEKGGEARGLASELGEQAEAKIAKGRKALEEERILYAARYFSTVAIRFEGCRFGGRALDMLRDLRDKPRTWTGKKGQKIKAAFAGLRRGRVYFKMPNGQTGHTRLNKLSKEDREMARRFSIVESVNR